MLMKDFSKLWFSSMIPSTGVSPFQTITWYQPWKNMPIFWVFLCLKKIPFNGLEAIPKSPTIAAGIHLKKSEVESNWTTKGNLPGLTSQFLIKKAFDFIETGSMIAFETVLALLIYRLVLFPNINDFVDINAIKIFLIGNPVPTLLGD